jgi:hypothetical protein
MHALVQLIVAPIRNGQLIVAGIQPLHAIGLQAVALNVLRGPLPAAHELAVIHHREAQGDGGHPLGGGRLCRRRGRRLLVA